MTTHATHKKACTNMKDNIPSSQPLPTVKSLEWFRVKPRWLFVKLTDSDGGFGWGEATLEGHDKAVEGALDEMADRLIGLVAESVFT
jgi:galactonate dehydratase